MMDGIDMKNQKHYNELSPAQVERLALLAEEMGEALQVVGKILRHGLNSSNPLIENAPKNFELLEKELGDVTCAISMLCDGGDIDLETMRRHRLAKHKNVQQWLHHQN